MAEWFGDHWRDVLNVVAFLVTAVGLGLAFWQLRKVRRATEAAQRALNEAAYRLSLNQLLVLTTQLLSVEEELEGAVQAQQATEAARVLIRWRQLASQLRGRVVSDDPRQEPLLEELKVAIPLTVKAVDALASQPKNARHATRVARGSIARASDEIGALMAQLTMDLGKGEP